MEMIAHGGKPRGGRGPSKAVAREFVMADIGRKFGPPKKKKKPMKRAKRR
jgi:hypothetical protein